ncbi:protein ANTAGONIST OF LIKE HETEROCHROMATIN PROTEIN 1 isoform X4 [Elaeis guineensis]|uniref:protein ANTAGONIST OF LIKE HETEROCHROMATIN PROTEIN 1 isoform X4 n=1 Tax=Elaeis guineensis var. tenera TaxID=51953 RepID=UPI003C6CCADD
MQQVAVGLTPPSLKAEHHLQRPTPMGGGKRHSSAASTSGKKSRPSPSPPFTADDLTPVLSLLASAVSLSLRFLSDSDLLLLPSQTLSLESSLLSSSFSLSRLLSLLPSSSLQSLQTLALETSPSSSSSSSSWFLRFLSSSSSHGFDPRWIEVFRMSKPSFYLLLQHLSPSLLSDPSSGPPDHKLGAALFRLAHAAPFRGVARRFGLPSPAAACRAFYQVCKAVADQLGHLFELSSDLQRVVQGFTWMSLPNCCGVLGFARFSVEGELKGGSVIAQGLVDSEGRFLDVSVGWHGSMTPAQIITRTKLYKAQHVVLAGGPPVELNGVSVPRYLLGSSCCPLLPWLLTPFKMVDSRSSSSKDSIFNSVHARGMELADRAFGRVRARWQLLQTSWKEDCAEALPYVVVASCLLHNYLIKCSEPMPDEIEVCVKELKFLDFEGKEDEAGERIRDALASHMSLVTCS